MLFFTFLFSTLALAQDFSISGGIFYFSNDDRRIASLETESAEGGKAFRFERDKKTVAGELAREEVRQGNVCLQQVAWDLEEEMKKPLIHQICAAVFEDELARNSRDKKEALVCSAHIEAHQDSGQLQLSVVFRMAPPPQDYRQNRMISSVGANDFKVGEEISRQSALLGKPAGSWKGLLKNGSCRFNEKILTDLHRSYLAILNGGKELNQCNAGQRKQLELLGRLQTEFKEYVPDEWLKKFKSEQVELLLIPATDRELYSSLSECRAARRLMAERISRLQKIASTIAEEHNVPALRPENRRIASELDEI